MNHFAKQLLISSLIFAFTSFASAGTEGMPSMPKIEPKRTINVQGNEDFESQQGFGDQAPMVQMMNLMMVEGSGLEGMEMDMAQNEHAGHEGHKIGTSSSENRAAELPYDFQVKIVPGPAKVGTNTVELTITDTKNQKPTKGLKLKAQVYMTSMDMGTEEPKVKEVAPGKYQVKAAFTMMGPWAVKLILPDGKEKVFDFEVSSKK